MHFRLLTDCKSMICDLNSQLYLKKNRWQFLRETNSIL